MGKDVTAGGVAGDHRPCVVLAPVAATDVVDDVGTAFQRFCGNIPVECIN